MLQSSTQAKMMVSPQTDSIGYDFVVRFDLSNVGLPWTNIFLYSHFYVLIDVLLEGMVESSLLSKDEPLPPNIDKVTGV